ncbi:MAG: PAS domain S-box protein, partial [Nitrospirota bacterium]
MKSIENSRLSVPTIDIDFSVGDWMNSVPIPGWICDSEAKRISFNPEWYSFSNCRKSDITLDKWLEIVHPDDREKWLRRIAHFVEGESKVVVPIEYRHFHCSGEYRWVIDRVTIIKDSDENILGLAGFIIDIDERKEFEFALSDRKERFESLYNGAQIGLYKRSFQTGQMLECNEFMARIFEYDNVEDMQTNFKLNECYVSKDDLEYVSDQLRRFGEIQGFRGRFRTKKNNIIWIEVSAKANPEIAYVEGFAYDITKLAESEEQILQLSKAVEQSPVSIVITDTQGRIEYVNPKFTELTGYDSSEVIGKNPSILKSGHYSTKDYQLLWSTILSGQEWVGEFLNKNKAGKLFWESARISPIRDSNGVIKHFLAIKEDITEQKKAEKKAREQYRFIQTLIDSIPTPVFYKDRNHQYLGCNKAFEQILGLSKEQIIGKTVLEMSSDTDPQLHFEIDQELLNKGGSKQYESTLKTASGDHKQLMNFKATFKDESGNIAGIIASILDITEHKRLETALRNSRNFLQIIIDAIGDPIFVKDDKHRHILDNEALSRLLGRTKEELHERTDYDFLPREQVEIFWKQDDLVLKTEAENVNEEYITDSTGSVRTIITKKNCFADPAGNKFIVGVIRDITEIRT